MLSVGDTLLVEVDGPRRDPRPTGGAPLTDVLVRAVLGDVATALDAQARRLGASPEAGGWAGRIGEGFALIAGITGQPHARLG